VWHRDDAIDATTAARYCVDGVAATWSHEDATFMMLK